MKRISQREIANLLGVNVSTVSRALRGLEGVSQELRQKILSLAKEQGYRPNPFAVSLRYDTTRTTNLNERITMGYRNDWVEVSLDGIDSSQFPEWQPTLDRFVTEGLLTHTPLVGAHLRGARGHLGEMPLPSENIYYLTERGTEVCDTILEELV